MQRFNRITQWLPMLAIAGLGFLAFQQYQASQATKPDYDQPLAAGLKGLAPQVGQSYHADLVSVADGDTITVRQENGQQEKIRFCGIDAPEVAHGEKPGQPFGKESREKLRSLIATAGNRVIVSPSERDRYGRMVAEVFIRHPKPSQPEEELLLNYELVRSGMAYHYVQYSGRCLNGSRPLEQGEAEAKAQRLGVWSGEYQRPWDFRKSQRWGEGVIIRNSEPSLVAVCSFFKGGQHSNPTIF